MSKQFSRPRVAGSRGLRGKIRRRALGRFESLESRAMLDAAADAGPSPWRNPIRPHDVNGDGRVAPLDALIVINELNARGAHVLRDELAPLADDGQFRPGGRYMDVNGDRRLSPLDALMVINQINGAPQLRIEMVVTDLADVPITEIAGGSDFLLQAQVTDLRTTGATGVAAAYVDVGYNASLVSVDPGPPVATIDHTPDYTTAVAGDVSVPGLVDEAGGFRSIQPNLPGPFKLWSLRMQASLAGLVTFAPDPADLEFEHASLLFGSDEIVPTTEIDYVAVQLLVTGGPPPAISILNATVIETDSGTVDAVFPVTLTRASEELVTVAFSTTANTAISPQDFQATAGTLTFNPGETTQNITVRVNGDTDVEAAETFLVNLTNAANASIADDLGLGTITDNDSLPTIRVLQDITITEPVSGQANAVFTVELSRPVGSNVTVGFATVNDSAVQGIDYIFQTGRVTFAPSQTLQSVTVPVLADGDIEVNEQFFLNLSSAVGGTIVDAQGICTIVDSDQPGFSVADTVVVEGDSGTSQAIFVVTLSLGAPLTQPATVSFNTLDSTATQADLDYIATSGVLTFAPGVSTQRVTVNVTGDTRIESNERFFLLLSNAVGTGIIDDQATGTIQDDDDQSGATKLVRIRLEVTDLAGNALPSPVDVGTPFLLRGLVEDLRPDGEDQGVFGAYLDVMFNPTPLAITGPVDHGVDYVNDVDGTLTTAGLIDEVGGLGPLDAAELSGDGILFSIPMQATAPGLIEFDAEPADILPKHHVLIYGLDSPVTANMVDYQDTELQVGRNFFSVDDVQVSEGAAGETATAVFTVTRNVPDPGPATVVVTTSNGTAVAPGDYTSLAATTLTFDGTLTVQQVTVQVIGDGLNEADETFQVNLSGAVGAVVGDERGLGTIENDDDAPTVSIGDATAEEGQTLVFPVTLSFASGQSIVVGFATSDLPPPNNATANVDYTATAGAITFAAGQTQAAVSVVSRADARSEPDEQFRVSLANSPIAAIGDGIGIGTIVNAALSGVRGFVYVDGDNDGVKDAGELGIEGVLVTASQAGAKTTTRTDADGLYSFPELLPGTYTISETQPGFFVDGLDTPESLRIANDRFSATVAVGQPLPDLNFGERGLRPEFLGAYLNRRAFFASSIITGIGGPTTVGQDMDLRLGDVYVSFDGGWSGLRRLELDFLSTGGTAKLELYDVNFKLLAASAPELDHAQIDYKGTSGQTYFLKITGNNPDVDFKITELFSINNVRVNEGDAGTQNVVLTVSIAGPLAEAASVNYSTQDGTALAPGDYTTTSGVLTFAPGEVSRQITVQIAGDLLGEPNESFKVLLSNPTVAAIGDGEGLATILDNDLLPLALAEEVFGSEADWLG